MPIGVVDFTNAAYLSNVTKSRDIVLTGNINNPSGVAHGRLGRCSCTAADKAMNDATRTAFRSALKNQFGVFGTEAFDAVLGKAKTGTSLCARDVREIAGEQLSKALLRGFENELMRQRDTHPELQKFSPDERMILMKELSFSISRDPAAQLELRNYSNRTALAEYVNQKIKNLTDAVANGYAHIGRLMPSYSTHTDIPAAPNPENDPKTAMGLSRWKSTNAATTLRGSETSVEDRLRAGTLTPGMRLNNDSSAPMLLEKLKTNGVEPGFIFRNDWNPNDTNGLMLETSEFKATFLDEAANAPNGSQLKLLHEVYTDAMSRGDAVVADNALTGIMLSVGARHPASVSFAAEYMMRAAQQMPANQIPPQFKAMSLLKDALAQFEMPPLTTGKDFTDEQRAFVENFKKTHFALLRDAVMQGPPPNDPMHGLPAFQRFTDRHIAKLDYNEGDRVQLPFSSSISKSMLRLPERVAHAKKPGAKESIKAFFYHKFRLSSAEKASVGAVAEALANDLTRIAGVPAQDLSLIRGEYSDGTPKIMLEAKFATGYQDFEGNFIRDGRIQMPIGKQAESLGKYKAMFLLLADRDAIGSRGQNKGLINGRFFAIDPGHSLEGNGKDLEIRDNFSFTDTRSSSYAKRFLNFSVFDDAPRFEKFIGYYDLRTLLSGQEVKNLFDEYEQTFNVQNAHTDQERKLYAAITERIREMRTELDQQAAKMERAFGQQVTAYEALLNSPIKDLAGDAIEFAENLEKLTSPTTWTSANGEVQLKHLEVIEESRIPWQISYDFRAGTIKYSTPNPVAPEVVQSLRQFVSNEPSLSDVTIFSFEERCVFIVPEASAGVIFNTLREDYVAEVTHNAEYRARHTHAG